MKKIQENDNGITLIALVITIIVLLILAGVTISMLTGEEGIIIKAQQAKENTIIAQEKEQIANAYATSLANNLDYDITEITIPGASVSPNYDGSYNVNFNETGNNYILDSNGEIESIGIAPSESVARIGSNYYDTLQGAIDSVKDNTQTSIILMKDISENVAISENQNIVLNLGNKTIKNLSSDNPIINLSGKLAIKNGNITGNYENSVPCIVVNINSEINLSDTNISRDSESTYQKETVELHGTLNIDSGKIANTNQCAIWSYTDADVKININGTAELYSSSTDYVTLYNNTTGVTKITGGKVRSESSNAIRNEGRLEISGTAEISSNIGGSPTIYNYSTGILIITGGTITKNTSVGYAIYNKGGDVSGVTGGNISNKNW